MATKITKSELKNYIKEVLREELAEARGNKNPTPPATIKIVRVEPNIQKNEDKWRHYDTIVYLDPIYGRELRKTIYEEKPGFGRYFGWGDKHSADGWDYAAYDYEGNLLPNVDPSVHISADHKKAISALHESTDASIYSGNLRAYLGTSLYDIDYDIPYYDDDPNSAFDDIDYSFSGTREDWINKLNRIAKTHYIVMLEVVDENEHDVFFANDLDIDTEAEYEDIRVFKNDIFSENEPFMKQFVIEPQGKYSGKIIESANVRTVIKKAIREELYKNNRKSIVV